MAKKSYRTDFRVEVYPRHPGDFGFASIGGMTQSECEWESQCRDIAGQIERHVDGLPSRGSKTQVVWDTESVCEHCGSRWTEDGDTFNGGCCDKDMENEPQSAESGNASR